MLWKVDSSSTITFLLALKVLWPFWMPFFCIGTVFFKPSVFCFPIFDLSLEVYFSLWSTIKTGCLLSISASRYFASIGFVSPESETVLSSSTGLRTSGSNGWTSGALCYFLALKILSSNLYCFFWFLIFLRIFLRALFLWLLINLYDLLLIFDVLELFESPLDEYELSFEPD